MTLIKTKKGNLMKNEVNHHIKVYRHTNFDENITY